MQWKPHSDFKWGKHDPWSTRLEMMTLKPSNVYFTLIRFSTILCKVYIHTKSVTSRTFTINAANLIHKHSNPGTENNMCKAQGNI
jgi:hypothetical protein